MTKSELRKKYKFKRKALSATELEDLSIDIANNALKLPVWEKSFYHLFLSIEKQYEVNTEYILNILQGKDKNVVLSKSDFQSHSMTHYLLTDDTTIKKNEWGIPEPVDGIEISNSKIDVVFVPLLAFDENGHRVGYGKGFYDTFLSQCHLGTLKIGLSFFYAEEQIEDIKVNDIGLDYCVTPNQIYTFSR